MRSSARGRFVAVVASYNRKAMLADVLRCLQAQTRPLDAILVVDNASPDGAATMVENDFPDALLFQTGTNAGGAGAFAWGVELAIALGFDGAWLMDDDAMPEPDALECLLECPMLLEGDGIGFVASVPVTSALEVGAGNHPAVETDFRSQVVMPRGYLAAKRVSFVGVLVNLAVAKRTDLPNEDFFIWGDDTEYTARLAELAGGAVRLDSRIVHESPAVSALETPTTIGWKYRYLIRNNIWQMRWVRDNGYKRTKAKQLLRAMRDEVRYAKPRLPVLLSTAKAVAAGIGEPRRSHPVGSKLASSPAARSWIESITTQESAVQA